MARTLLLMVSHDTHGLLEGIVAPCICRIRVVIHVVGQPRHLRNGTVYDGSKNKSTLPPFTSDPVDLAGRHDEGAQQLPAVAGLLPAFGHRRVATPRNSSRRTHPRRWPVPASGRRARVRRAAARRASRSLSRAWRRRRASSVSARLGACRRNGVAPALRPLKSERWRPLQGSLMCRKCARSSD
jgi:hypothetical protein